MSLSPMIALLAPAALALAAAICLRSDGRRPGFALAAAQVLAFVALLASLAGLAIVVTGGTQASLRAGWSGIGLSVRLDAVSIIMLLLVSFIGWVVIRFSATCLDGEKRQGAFAGWLCATLASVLLLVQAGTLTLLVIAWVLSSLFLHRLLLFYLERPGARRAARKKFIMARLGDLAILGGALLLVAACGSDDIGAILDRARASETVGLMPWAAALLAVAAMLKSAIFPTGGWLTEVMEAPTPVSALLHAGVINAGGFLLIRFADVMLTAPVVMALLVAMGGFTAIVAGLVMLTQSAVKTSLAWSTMAQMGFMVMQCGLALFPLALLHIVAHSLYKAHAFLASGSAVENVVSIARPGPIAVPGFLAVARAFALALVIYALVGAVFGFAGKSPQALALGAILIFGTAYLLAQGMAELAPRALTWRMARYAMAAAAGYFALQSLAEALTASVLPPAPTPGALEWTLIVLALTSFGAVAFAQSAFPLWSAHPAAAGLRIHLANGLYANAVLDRLLRGWLRQPMS